MIPYDIGLYVVNNFQQVWLPFQPHPHEATVTTPPKYIHKWYEQVRYLHAAFNDYITKWYRQQAEVIQYHENEHVRST
jgi:hypothetical protein